MYSPESSLFLFTLSIRRLMLLFSLHIFPGKRVVKCCVFIVVCRMLLCVEVMLLCVKCCCVSNAVVCQVLLCVECSCVSNAVLCQMLFCVKCCFVCVNSVDCFLLSFYVELHSVQYENISVIRAS